MELVGAETILRGSQNESVWLGEAPTEIANIVVASLLCFNIKYSFYIFCLNNLFYAKKKIQ